MGPATLSRLSNCTRIQGAKYGFVCTFGFRRGRLGSLTTTQPDGGGRYSQAVRAQSGSGANLPPGQQGPMQAGTFAGGAPHTPGLPPAAQNGAALSAPVTMPQQQYWQPRPQQQLQPQPQYELPKQPQQAQQQQLLPQQPYSQQVQPQLYWDKQEQERAYSSHAAPQGYLTGIQTYQNTAPPYQMTVPAAQSYLPTMPAPAPSYAGASQVERINPAKAYLNSVTALGTLLQPQMQGRTARAVLQVPFATKAGHQEFVIEAWDEVASQLLSLHGAQVVVEGRLANSKTTNSVVVVVKGVKLVDPTLPREGRSITRGSKSGSPSADGTEGRTSRSSLDAAQLFRTHYETQTQNVQALAQHYGRTPRVILETLLSHAYKTKSPLRWRALAEEAGLGAAGGPDALTLDDFISVVGDYLAEFSASTPEAVPAVSKDGMLKVKPIRDWALAKGKDNPHHYVVSTYQGQRGEGSLYDVLRMAVVAEATKGVWDHNTEFSAQS